MRKLTKVFVASTIAMGTLVGVGVSTAIPVNGAAHAANAHYYTYQGYIKGNGSFLIKEQFIKAVKSNNVTFNGIKLTHSTGTKMVDKYDQHFEGVANDGIKAKQVQFTVTKDLTLNQLKKAYGKDLIKKSHNKNKDGGIFCYTPSGKGLGVLFVVDNSRVVAVTIGYSLSTPSK
ncbi:hypothetical protein DB790_02445 [Staphylococcus capitis]|uniref:immunodominant staphylococcal antigen IsaB family protein n=1 Tax=Staphylococcus capitis TaxID=29388 RepID=UPI000F5C5546|nr:hypothetical protein [Staphylococcus capitis]RQX47276.1 hypothetical protein DB790_02445 [Staphylococcus capitis]